MRAAEIEDRFSKLRGIGATKITRSDGVIVHKWPLLAWDDVEDRIDDIAQQMGFVKLKKDTWSKPGYRLEIIRYNNLSPEAVLKKEE